MGNFEVVVGPYLRYLGGARSKRRPGKIFCLDLNGVNTTWGVERIESPVYQSVQRSSNHHQFPPLIYYVFP